MSEFALIDRFFASLGARREDVVLGVGDDAALLVVPPAHELVAAVDTIVAGRHFPEDASGADVGWRSLAVNLSDLAAMGARPAWATLALTLPALDEDWLEDFAHGFGALATANGVSLVGGDTTRGPLTVSVQVLGHAPAGRALRRSGARVGDLVYVTGWPGDAAAGLAVLQGRLVAAGANRAVLTERFRRPEPRVAFGQRLVGIASACIDVSDGLAQDLGRLAAASAVAAVIRARELPLSRALHAAAGEARAREFALAGGDDYELLFTVPPAARTALAGLLAGGAPACHCIGEIVAGRGVRVVDERGDHPAPAGFDHFR
ncbi:MAG: thiamine-phosphate kinase [Steroidobacteraceae bacterium]|jgi:thiamine-monophosphate kinase|nr:thiamine-phosphate kinase [Steroidobacteraceae bacterium]